MAIADDTFFVWVDRVGGDEGASVKDLADSLGVSSDKVRRQADSLIKQGRLEQVGNEQHPYYRKLVK